jgi:hypothetical protein
MTFSGRVTTDHQRDAQRIRPGRVALLCFEKTEALASTLRSAGRFDGVLAGDQRLILSRHSH